VLATERLEQDLRRRFDVREETFVHADASFTLIMPRDVDTLLDATPLDDDERIPYWAELWPSARALTRHLLEVPPLRGPVLELGCGLALPSLALRRRGVEVVASDWLADALAFAAANARRNGLGELATTLLDWRSPPAGLGPFPTIVAADVLYEGRNVDALLHTLGRLLAPGGEVVLADPERRHLDPFLARLREEGWDVEEFHRQPGPPAVSLLRARPPATAG
jgi:predicted nicotinamide N-methyase